MSQPESNSQDLPTLTARQEHILTTLVQAHCEQPDTISSQFLADETDLGVSAATIRNEMAILEDRGYLASPHPSAGRIPTERGYRYFVTHLLREINPQPQEQRHIERKFRSLPSRSDDWLRLAASLLASRVNAASLVTKPVTPNARLKHVQLIAIQGHLVLLVLVTKNGGVHQRMVNLETQHTQEQLSQIANLMNDEYIDLSANRLRIAATTLPTLQREILELVAELLEQDARHVHIAYRGGLPHLLTAFAGDEGSQQALRVFEEEAIYKWILGEFAHSQVNQVQVVIAGDGRVAELSRLTLVLSQYGLPDQAVGTIGVLGPTHLNYSRAISTVSNISHQLTELIEELYSGISPA